MRQKIRKSIGYLALLLFPLSMNYFSPYLSVMAAMEGIIAGSVIVFFLMFLSGIVFGRSWCAFVCPMAGLSEMTNSINGKVVNRNKLSKVRYVIFSIWFSIILIFFILNGSIVGIRPLFMSENIISIDMPLKYITYYLVLGIFILINLLFGKRVACHSICWMSPFLEAGFWLGSKLKIKQLRILSISENCINCKKCNQVCPMSIDVMKSIERGYIKTKDCILCGECVDACPKVVLSYGFRQEE
ncbi:MAG: 4Fe-4S dicluster domain-containing protein [Firmicutes bacterium]|nr:4Fe-4S dicluster domain-containing protein [Bacillota bacterium]